MKEGSYRCSPDRLSLATTTISVESLKEVVEYLEHCNSNEIEIRTNCLLEEPNIQ